MSLIIFMMVSRLFSDSLPTENVIWHRIIWSNNWKWSKKKAAVFNFKVFWSNLATRIYWDIGTPRKLRCMTPNIVTTSAKLSIIICYFQRSFRLAKETIYHLHVFQFLNRLSELIKILYKIISAEERKYSEKPPSQCHFVRHKSIMTAMGMNPGLGGKTTATNPLGRFSQVLLI
jgi:hypothetical protein